MTTALVSRADHFADLVHTVTPGLLGMGGPPTAYELPGALMAGLVVWSPEAPVTQRETSFPFPPVRNFRPTLVDLLLSVPSGPAADVPSLTVGGPALPHAVAQPKSESGLAFTGALEVLRSIATTVTLSEELANDAVGLQAWLEGFLVYLVKVGEEAEILTGPRGFLTRPDIPAYAGAATDMEAILAEAHGQVVTDSGGIEPDTYVLAPADWAALIGLGFATIDANESRMNGCDVVRSPALAPGQALVGACQSASLILRNGGIVVEGTNSHDLNFQKNVAMLRAASRIALGVLVPTAFVKVG